MADLRYAYATTEHLVTYGETSMTSHRTARPSGSPLTKGYL